MPLMRAQFGAVNTELPANLLPSGTADDVLNIVYRRGRLAKRAGFTLEDGAQQAVKRMIQGPDGLLYTRTVVGWFYKWANRTYFNCATGSFFGTQTGASGGTKAGLPRPPNDAGVGGGDTTLVKHPTATGAKEGEYRVHWAFYNSATGEESVVSLPPSALAPVETRASAGDGALRAGNLPVADHANYDYDKIKAYCTHGNTERLFNPCMSFQAYFEVLAAWNVANIDMAWPDFVHGTKSHPAFLNNGGEPPASIVGCFDGLQALYIVNGQNGRVEFSILTKPTMIPREELYEDSNGGWSLSALVQPKPWLGRIERALPTDAKVAATGGGRILVFTNREAVEFRRSGTGQLWPFTLFGHGCKSDQGAISTLSGVMALTPGGMILFSGDGIRNVSHQRYTPTLEAIATPANVVLGFYSHAQEVWLAEADDIYIFDALTGAFKTKWTVAGIGVISAMCEWVPATGSPCMRIASSTGIWQYDPDSWATQTQDDTTDFAAHWQGYYGTERLALDQHLRRMDVHMGANAKGEGDGTVTITVTGIRTAADASSSTPATLVGTARHIRGVMADPLCDGNFFRIKIETDSSPAADYWQVDEMVLQLGATR